MGKYDQNGPNSLNKLTYDVLFCSNVKTPPDLAEACNLCQVYAKARSFTTGTLVHSTVCQGETLEMASKNIGKKLQNKNQRNLKKTN